ncbi:TonB-linked outer membrane protein, SusC/RagA family [Sphingobacterium nematocida]|uniref:TonB-linked outer membrane protein, SusC/RagA family n=1 Tax=Sphingobacterium nematocida TaxID=1513896 RepID=A0A1T5DFE4_9SPHI|nr:SusC/RagA family TonB-linked outer membrane protein [Sphingobacterium nematocida]SKB70386.1 TonB-linked outer membrane protein, SusC/RagA family [Sphingobacterium nematocida]
MKYTLGICFAMFANLTWAAAFQRVHIEKKQLTLQECLNEIKKQTGYSIVHLENTFDKKSVVYEDLKNTSLDEALAKLFAGKDVAYTVREKTIVLSKKEKMQQQRSIELLVQSSKGDPISGATIVSTVTKKAIGQTNSYGTFKGDIPTDVKTVLVKHILYRDEVVTIGNQTKLQIKLKEKENEIEETVITGIYTRNKDSFTGSSSTFSQKELKMIGNTNVLQALKTLDPSFAIAENNLAGSDPNALPDINIRGKTSVIGLQQEFNTDPNQPLFILDGFESSLAAIFDLSMDRIESVTLLKDATATAIYGAKAANGVVVVETVKPKAGQLRLSYNNSTNFTFADLTDYNLMNAREKLQFEKLSGFYGNLDQNGNILNETKAITYNNRLAEVARGVDSYWMNEPLRKTISDRHNLFAEGGDDRMRYGLGFNYGNTRGVMKGSNRNLISGNVRLTYRLNNFSFTNYFTVDYNKAENNVVPFSSFSATNPYYKKYDEYGEILRVLEEATGGNSQIYNPMYDYYLRSFNNATNLDLRNNFETDWRVLSELRLRGRFSFAKTSNNSKLFKSPLASEFETTSSERKGSFNETQGNGNSFDFDFSATYGKSFGISGQHIVNAVIGTRAVKNEIETNGYTVYGYKSDDLWAPNFSNGYLSGSKPSYSFADKRSLSYYLNAGYSFKNTYLLDANVRYDGSSIFGTNNKFTNTWSLGLAWNIHNEKLFEGIHDKISMLKLRGSIGNPGNQNFDAYMVLNMYTYNVSYTNPFGLSALISKYGNSNLEWQKTLDRNLGLDLETMGRKLRINLDYFNKMTDPLLIYVQVPTSTGTGTTALNVGGQKTSGFTTTFNYRILQRNEFMWSANFNTRYLNSTYHNIGTTLDQLNDNNKLVSKNLERYYDGGSTTALWAVKSLGIDPGTGREVFEKKDGTQTFVHDYSDEKEMGNTTPTVEGVVGSSLFYKGFSASANFRYRVGGQIFLNTLFDKVENITLSRLQQNQDKRALYDRWQKSGDVTQFKSISLTEPTQMSSRFVADENTFSCESISLGYETNAPWTKKIGLSSFNTRFYMNEIFRISTVKNERGIDYPFARSLSLSIGARF